MGRYKRQKYRRLFFGAGLALCLLKRLHASLILPVFATKFSILFSSSGHQNVSWFWLAVPVDNSVESPVNAFATSIIFVLVKTTGALLARVYPPC